MPCPTAISLTVLEPILAKPELALPGDRVLFTGAGECYLVRQLPLNYGRWLGYLTDGAASEHSHSLDQTMVELIRRAGASPAPPNPARARSWRRPA